MSGKAEQLVWEWPGDRSPDIRILIEIDSISPTDLGLTGSMQSPSLAGYLPDPTDLGGVVRVGPDAWIGKQVSLRLPRSELRALETGQTAGLGVLGEATCICVVAAPQDLTAAAAEAWLATMPCGG